MRTPIIQFGTSRFLQAHADLFIAEALPKGQAIGKVTVVETTGSPGSLRRVAAFNEMADYPVRIRGIEDGAVVDREVRVDSVARGISANRDWDALEALFVDEAEAILSNTADRGYELFPEDTAEVKIPRSFPAKLTRLLHARWRHAARPLDIFACELISDNGRVLRDTVSGIARSWQLESDFVKWLENECRWPCSLVDRIVSRPLDPIGAEAEPYALWAIEKLDGLEPPCVHEAIKVTDDLKRYERLKLLLLNGGHTFLAERWLADGRPADEMVREAIADPALARELAGFYDEEVLPVFAAIGLGAEAEAYRQEVLERFSNPFLDHRLSEIAGNHAAKKTRRFEPVVALAKQHCPDLELRRIRAALASGLG